MTTPTHHVRASTATAFAASIGVALAELCVLVLRRPDADARAVGALALFAVLGGVLVGAVAATLARVRREPGWVWALALWSSLVFAHVAPLGRGGKLALAACGVGALAIGWIVSRAALGLARRSAATSSLAGSVGTWGGAGLVCSVVLAAIGFARREEDSETESATGSARPSVLLVTIDTLRADFVGCYGRSSARTPTIDGLAASGYRFESATTHTMITGPSHATILTGRVPAHHGVFENLQPLARSVPTVAESFAAQGYRTGAFVSGYPLQQRAAGMLRRFEHFDDDFRDWKLLPGVFSELVLGRWLALGLEHSGRRLDPHSRSAAAVTEVANAWLDAPSERPYFAWVHYFDPHLPYEPPPELLTETARAYRGLDGSNWYRLSARERTRIASDAAALRQMNELYDAEIASVDRELARLVDAARRNAGAAGVWIVLTSDHGESFGEHGIFFERDLYEDSVHVPLILVPPTTPTSAQVIPEPVGLVDLAPTLLECAGSTFDGDGRSLLALTRGEPWPPREYVAEIFTPTGIPLRRPAYSVRAAAWKLIVRANGWNNSEFAWRASEDRELYDLERDRAELDNRAAAETARVQTLEGAGTELRRRAVTAPLELGESELQKLRELGYAH